MAELQTVIAKTSGLQLKLAQGLVVSLGGHRLASGSFWKSFATIFCFGRWHLEYSRNWYPALSTFVLWKAHLSVSSQPGTSLKYHFLQEMRDDQQLSITQVPQGLGANLASKKRVKFSGKTWSLGGSESCLQWHVKLLRGRGVLGTLGLHADGLRFL